MLEDCSTSRPRRAALRAALGLLFLAFAVPMASAQESASFRLDRISFAAVAGPVSSAHYATTITIAQEGPVGSLSRCNDGFLQNTGFWSILGESPVPVWLRVGKNGVDPAQVDLGWSGSSSQFSVYRAEFADSLAEPYNILTTIPDCALTDAPPSAPITFYLVLPTGI
jgi:hypothetical protein